MVCLAWQPSSHGHCSWVPPADLGSPQAKPPATKSLIYGSTANHGGYLTVSRHPQAKRSRPGAMLQRVR